MTQYMPAPYQQPFQADSRSRNSSNASRNRYVPDSYFPPPAQNNGSGYDRPRSSSRGPMFNNQPIPVVQHSGQPTTPYPPTPYGSSPGMPVPQSQLQPGYPNTPSYQPQRAAPYPVDDRDGYGYIRPPMDPRRLSTTSARSTRSHHSTHSNRSNRSSRSHHSHRSGHSYFSRNYDRDRDYDRERERETRRRHSHGHDRDGKDYRPLKRTSTHRPSWGDTVFGMFDVIKDYLGPRDKY